MNSQQLYLQDPLRVEFEAEVVAAFPLEGGRTGMVLDRSYFYPTGGGQPFDTGFLGSAQVVDVYKDEANQRSVHVVVGPAPSGRVAARIDFPRRLRHMQHHSAQHLLSYCFIQQFGLDTLSAHISGEAPTTIDLPLTPLTAADLQSVEDLANAILYENRPVKSYFVAPADLPSLPLRRQPAVSEDIRIVEIEGLDYTPCGGTHVLSTGMIGVLKLLKTEKRNDRTRVSFAAGRQALDLFQEYHRIVTDLAGQLSVGAPDLPATILRQGEQLQAAQRELQGLRAERLQWEADQLAEAGTLIAGRRLALGAFQNRPTLELRALGEALRVKPNTIGVLASHDGQKLTLVTSAHPETGLDARRLLQQLLAPLSGRGGGELSLAQGGAPATAAQVEAILQSAGQIVPQLFSAPQE